MEKYALPSEIRIHDVEVLEEINIVAGSLQQGILIDSRQQYYSTNHSFLYKYDSNWKLLREKKFVFRGIKIPHMGILSLSGKNLLVGVVDLASYKKGMSNTRIVEIDSETFEIIVELDFSEVSRYIDAFVVYENQYWISYKDFVSVYNYVDSLFVFDKRYKILTGTAQGMRIKDNKLFMIPENNLMRVRELPNGLYCYDLDKLHTYGEDWFSTIVAFTSNILSSLNYQLDFRVLNRFFSWQINDPSELWPFGFPYDAVDNEGFSFVPNYNNVILISDVTGKTARKIRLVGF